MHGGSLRGARCFVAALLPYLLLQGCYICDSSVNILYSCSGRGGVHLYWQCSWYMVRFYICATSGKAGKYLSVQACGIVSVIFAGPA